MKIIKLENGITVKVVYPEEVDLVLTDGDKEMDLRVKEAVRVAIKKTKFLKGLRKK